MWTRVDHALEQGRGGADGDRWIVDSIYLVYHTYSGDTNMDET